MKYYFLALATGVVVCVGCAMDGSQILDKDEYVAPPAAMLQRPGPMVDGPGPGVMPMLGSPGGTGVVPAAAWMPDKPGAAAHAARMPTTQIKFLEPKGMGIGWQIPGGFAEEQIIAEGVYDFAQGAVYRLKLTDIPGREGPPLYPTLEVHPVHPTTAAYLSHNAIPIEITVEDLEQVDANNFVTKVIYLPDPKFQELAIAGVETLVSTRLPPGVDPVAEADRQGTIMLVLRMGNKNVETVPPADGPNGAGFGGGAIHQISYRLLEGEKGEFAPPMPIGRAGSAGPIRVPGSMIVGGASLPGHPAMHPIAGRGAVPSWGMPVTGTPIGLPGPAHLPLGGPAGLQSHTVKNDTDIDMGKPVDHFLLQVEHEPGYRLPKPARHVKYKEKHPVHKPGETSWPRRLLPF